MTVGHSLGIPEGQLPLWRAPLLMLGALERVVTGGCDR